jgi:hypothetical protein
MLLPMFPTFLMMCMGSGRQVMAPQAAGQGAAPADGKEKTD